MDQLAKNPGRQRGPRSIKEAIAHETSVHLTRFAYFVCVPRVTLCFNAMAGREWITEEMKRIDPTGFALRHPRNRRQNVIELLPQGPHQSWTGYGYEKLTKIGFPVWCMRDSWSINWLGMWVLPARSDRLAHASRYLGLVKSLEGIILYDWNHISAVDTTRAGMPLQGTTHDGKEATLTYSLTYALRQTYVSM